jgi:hypothetical protein
MGYLLGTELEYQMASWVTFALRSYGEKRHRRQASAWRTVSVSPALIFRSDWQSTDRIEVAYSRNFYSRGADLNTAAPRDRDVFILGATMTF